MSEQYPGGFITKTPPTPAGPYQDSTAQGMWTLSQAAGYKKQGLWPTAGNINLPWLNLQTGDSYLGGVIVRYATTIAVRWYPASRVTLGVTGSPTTVSTSQSVPPGVTSISIYGVGGGAGGTGTNGVGGGGGGAFSVTGVAVTPGQTMTITAGRGGRGGVRQSNASPVANFGNYPSDVGGQSGVDSSFSISGVISLNAGGGTAGDTNTPNPTDPALVGQGGVGTIISNPGGYSVTLGTGGRGGSRNLIPTDGTNGGAGAGGGNDAGPTSATNYDRGSAGSGRFGGGGGAGNGPGDYTVRTGGAGGTEAGAGGRGGSTDTGYPPGTFGLNGGYYTGQSAVANAGGRAYVSADGSTLGLPSTFQRGGSGGGGFPGGGGGSSYYGGTWNQDCGVSADGASGMIQIEWALP